MKPAPDVKSPLVVRVAELLKEGRAKDILVLDLDGLTSITDYFVICTANSGVQTRALVRAVEEALKGTEARPITRATGFDSMWVLVDCNYFVIHIFLKEGRDFYQLEKLWCDAKIVYSHEGDFL